MDVSITLYCDVYTRFGPQLTNYQDIDSQSLNGVLRDGLQILYGILDTQSHEQLVQGMRDSIETGTYGYIYSWNQDWIDEAVRDDKQDERRERWYSPRDSDQDWRQKMVFDGDRMDLPPLGWVLYWQGEYSNLVGDHIHFRLRRWGFVMWDAVRLTTEAKEFIEFWYTELHCPHDFREEHYDPSVAPPEYGSKGKVIFTAFPLASKRDRLY